MIDARQCWRTPPKLFQVFNKEVGGFDYDLFADEKNRLCPNYFSAESDAFSQLWRGNCFGNPPYGNDFPRRAIEHALESKAHGALNLCYLLLNSCTDTQWFNLAVKNCEIHFFTGRIRYLPPDGIKESQPRHPNLLIIIGTDKRGVTAMRNTAGEIIWDSNSATKEKNTRLISRK
jgi:phage N-6-adenine-methyltransferase